MAAKNKLSLADAQALAVRWGVSSRSIFAWRRAGVNLEDPAEVIERITNSQNPTPAMLAAAVREALIEHDRAVRETLSNSTDV